MGCGRSRYAYPAAYAALPAYPALPAIPAVPALPAIPALPAYPSCGYGAYGAYGNNFEIYQKTSMSCEKRKLNNHDITDSDNTRNEKVPLPNVKMTTTLNSTNCSGDKLIIEKKIRKIIESHFDEEINYKKYELERINERIFEAQNMLDKLRVCIVCNFYSSNGRIPLNEYINHPAIAILKCEHLEAAIEQSKSLSNLTTQNSSNNVAGMKDNQIDDDQIKALNQQNQQFDVKICVGNVSKYLKNKKNDTTNSNQECTESSQYNQDLITHKWMIYLRSPNCSKLDNYIKKVIFYLHSSYKPYDVVEVKNPPFQLARRGWGEFPIHVQIHFKDSRNKRIDINHNLKLDWTQTGLQTFGGETSCTCKLVIKPNDYTTDSAIQAITKPKESDVEETKDSQVNLKIQEELPSLSLQNEINSQYSIESYQTENQNGLPRNFSSSSLSSTSNSNLFSPLITQNSFNPNPSPNNFISTEPDSQIIQTTNNISSNQNSNFDDLFENLSKTKHNEEKIIQTGNPNVTVTKSSGTSLDALLNLRPKTIQLNKPISGTNLILPPKIVQPQIPNKIISSVNSKIVVPGINQINTVNNKSTNLSVTNNSFLNSLNKKLVIYKVGSDDLNGKSQVNENEPSDNKTNFLNKSLSSPVKLQHQHSALPTLSATKKLKLSIDQLTKIKSTQNKIETEQQPLAKQTDKTIQIQEISIKNQSNDQIKTTENFYSTVLLIEKIKSLNSTNKTIDFEALIFQGLKQYPIILNDDSKKSKKLRRKLPFCAHSIHEFYSWPYAKRRANEWMRALYIKKKCALLIEKYQLNENLNLWSTKSIVLWLRSHGYTPLEYQHMQIMSFDNKIMTSNENDIINEFTYIDSSLPIDNLKNSDYLKINDKEIEEDEDNVLIDVVNIEPKDVKKLKDKNSRNNLEIKDANFCDLNHLEMCSGSKYVKQQLDMLGIKANTISLVPSFETPDDTNLYTCDIVERFIFQLGKRFAEDLIRQVCSDKYFVSNQTGLNLGNSSGQNDNLNNSNKRITSNQIDNSNLSSQKFPDYLNVIDVFNTINKHDKYDFLTNKYMARSVKSDNTDNNINGKKI
ncbi:unnamed protein product [Brachionus calyciflorus]|uniref:YEATS domain-containing protein n=1 Tax=Brachionus calyciflorus TaxID=104777 RepID=A0A813M320_9BILA|nr:unnamed protein product [Brachionus calyciflorus]